MNGEALWIPAGIFLLSIVVLAFWGLWRISRKNQENSEPPILSATQDAEGRWIIRVYGKAYASLKDVPDEQARQAGLAAMRAIVLFGRDYVKRPQDSAPATTSQPSVPATTSQPSASAAKPTPGLFVDDETAPATRPATSAPAPAPARAEKPASARPITPAAPPASVLKARIRSESAPPPSTPEREAFDRESFADALLPMLDIAGEIEAIMREMQPRYPSLAQRAIRLQNAPGRGVRVVIDGIVYESVDAVPDPDIQALIRAATREWERR